MMLRAEAGEPELIADPEAEHAYDAHRGRDVDRRAARMTLHRGRLRERQQGDVERRVTRPVADRHRRHLRNTVAELNAK